MFNLFAIAVVCETVELPDITGAVKTSNIDVVTDSVPFTTAFTYQCYGGTKFENGYTSNTFTCNEHGKWTGPSTAFSCQGLTNLIVSPKVPQFRRFKAFFQFCNFLCLGFHKRTVLQYETVTVKNV